MSLRKPRSFWTAALLIFCLVGCNKPAEPVATKPAGESADRYQAAVAQQVAELQAALKAHDAAKVWQLLDSDSQVDADRAAKAIQAAYAKASPTEKAEQEKALGLGAAELGMLHGEGFLKTRRFQGKYDELAESKIDKITIQGDKATVQYTEPDGDKERLTLVRQDDKWRVALAMPKAN